MKLPAQDMFLALHTAEPGASLAHECGFGGYARARVPVSHWAAQDDLLVNDVPIFFAECTGSRESVTHLSLCFDAAGPSAIYLSGALAVPRVVSAGVTLSLQAVFLGGVTA